MKLHKNFNSSALSWFRTGGIVESFAIVENLNELLELLNKNKGKKISVIGAGSNILIPDCGFDGLLIKLSGDFLKIDILKQDNNDKNNNDVFIEAGSGLLVKKMTDFTIKNHIIGAEFYETIPATIGGAIYMNAGCFGCETKDILYSVKILLNSEIIEMSCSELNYSYRHSELPENSIIISGVFKLKKGNKDDIELAVKKIEEMKQHRKENQIVGATCGSTFKNPEGQKAWELIDKVGLRGYSVGGAKFSEKHCNFIVNTGKATATDIENLIKLAQEKVFEKFGIKLQLEIKILK